jgi:hypothetical protein
MSRGLTNLKNPAMYKMLGTGSSVTLSLAEMQTKPFIALLCATKVYPAAMAQNYQRPKIIMESFSLLW